MFAKYLIAGVNCSTIKERIKLLAHPNSWGNHLEVIGAATLFKIPVYYCTQSTPNSQFTWGAFQPISADKISFPLIVDEELQGLTVAISHIEMYYHDSLHYDAIETGRMCVTPPQLTGTDDPDIIEIS